MIGPARDEWIPVGGTTRRACPLCPDWWMDEPPPEILTEETADGRMTARMRWHSAVPAGLVHILTAHPDSEQARAIADHMIGMPV